MQIEHIAADNDDVATIRIEGLERGLKILQLTDSHMAVGDERDPDAAEHVARLRESFQQRTPGGVSAREVFDQALKRGAQEQIDAAVLTGDITHLPTFAAIEIIQQGLKELSVPSLYTLGNHDWHLSHLESSEATRSDYYPRFHGLTGGSPSHQVLELGGVRLITLDNSTYQVNAEQLAFLRQQLAVGQPCLLFVHIPLWVESLMPAVVEMWNAPIVMAPASGWTDESRVRWEKVLDPSPSTRECMELLSTGPSENVAGIFCGHVHFSHVDEYREGRCQYVTAPGFSGGYRLIQLEVG